MDVIDEPTNTKGIIQCNRDEIGLDVVCYLDIHFYK